MYPPKGVDGVELIGNLTMGQVTTIFQDQLEKGGLYEDLGYYGGTAYYSEAKGASNTALKNFIEYFIAGEEPVPSGYRAEPGKPLKLAIGKNITILLVRADALDHIGTDREQPRFDKLPSTHWTALNLTKDSSGAVCFRYANSTGGHRGYDAIPPIVKLILESFNITKQERFVSSPQTALNCGYLAIWHALQMLGVEVSNIEDFINEQKKLLKIQAGSARAGSVALKPKLPLKKSATRPQSSIPEPARSSELMVAEAKKITYGLIFPTSEAPDRNFFRPISCVDSKSDIALLRQSPLTNDNVEITSGNINSMIIEALKGAQKEAQLSNKQATAIILIAIKNEGIASNQAGLSRDFGKLEKEETAEIAKAKKFSAFFQEIMRKNGVVTGNQNALYPEVGMRLKRLTVAHAEAFCDDKAALKRISGLLNFLPTPSPLAPSSEATLSHSSNLK